MAIERLAHAMRLNPLDPEMYRMQNGMAFANLLAGRLDDALSWAEKTLREQPNYALAIGITAASSALAGRMTEARAAMQRLREIDPALRVSNLKEWLPIRRPEDFTKWSEGLRKAGLPE
jgi:predicted Zn-dependent protease